MRRMWLLAIALALSVVVVGGEVPLYHVAEFVVRGPVFGPSDAPARDVQVKAVFRHESGTPTIKVFAFWDGDGNDGAKGGVFKVRFCPTRPGRWRLAGLETNRPGFEPLATAVTCVASRHPGFWLPDGRWYRRSNGSHPFILGNTHYTFLSRRDNRGRVCCDPVLDIRRSARYYKKVRFSLFGGRYPDPTLKPFLDDAGRPSDDGRFAFRPNPAWFLRGVDPAVAEGFERDVVCDLILCGPDTRESRSTLKYHPRPWLRYVAARYGAYPNVWFCLANEWDIKDPRYTAEEIRGAGSYLRSCLAYPAPISVHGSPRRWRPELNGSWHDHVIIQYKVKRLPQAADAVLESFSLGGKKPVVNDENGYQGKGDGFALGDVVEGCLGTFLGGGYPTTGEKFASKKGQYFWGGFDPEKHSATKHLAFLRRFLEANVAFWRLEPVPLRGSAIENCPEQFRLLANEGNEYVLGSNARAEGLVFRADGGRWRVVQADLMAMRVQVLGEDVSGLFRFSTPASRAAITHFRKRAD